MKKRLKIKLNMSEMEGLLTVFAQYPIYEISDRNTRLMVHELLSRLGKQLLALIMRGGKERIVRISRAEAAAFDQAFRKTPIIASSFTLPLYEETLINRILNDINIIL